ncbi:MAG: CCA tRNA nucleotidyltransferase [Deltaproteobacteria bacterium]|nr:CCA tRNA nucleotidyltransferase [Deltaproteobacteria bacterium]
MSRQVVYFYLGQVRKMEVPDIINTILDRLQAAGYEAYLVGGAVRDMCLGRKPTDWDVGTSAPPDTLRCLFHDMRHFGLKECTITLVRSGRHCEVTTFRGQEEDAKTLQGDLGHRDFTIDAMAYDIHGDRLIDPFGGRHDLIKRKVRAVGNPRERFLEDPLRLVRAARLAAELDFRIDPGTLKAMSDMAEELDKVARERVRDELAKILMSKRPSRGLKILAKTDLLKTFLPELLEGTGKRQNVYHGYTIFRHIMETIDRVEPTPVLRLAALFHDIAKPRVRKKISREYRFLGHERMSAELAREIMERLRFGKGIIAEVTHLALLHMINYHSGWSDRAVRRFLIRVGPEHVGPLLALREADLIAHGRDNQSLEGLHELKKRIAKIHESAPPLTPRDLAVDGHTVMEILDLDEGPEVGRILKDLMEKVIENPELNTRSGLISLLKKIRAEDKAMGMPGKG